MKLANIPGLKLLDRILAFTMRAVETFKWEEAPLRENLRCLFAKATQDLVEAQPKPGSTDPLAGHLKDATDLLEQARRLIFSDPLIFSQMRIARLLRAKDLAERSEAVSTMIWYERKHLDLTGKENE